MGESFVIMNLLHFVKFWMWKFVPQQPSINDLIERRNAIYGLTVSKTVADNNCKLEIALNGTISAQNPLKKLSGY